MAFSSATTVRLGDVDVRRIGLGTNRLTHTPEPDAVVVATKGGYAPGAGRPEILREQIDESLGRLGVDAIDLYYLHRVHPDTPFEDSVGVLREAVDAGKIRHVGLSQV